MLEINKIYLGDCLEVMKLIDDKSIDMILCDLPYGTTACIWDIVIPFAPLWEQYKRIIKDNGAILLTADQPFTSMLVMSNLEMFNYVWIKEKGTGFIYSKKRPMHRKEDILVFYKKCPVYNFQGTKLKTPYTHILPATKGETYNTSSKGGFGDRKYVTYFYKTKDNVIEIARDRANRGVHPTQKPVALFEYLIKTYTNEKDLILDNCIGSGTTAIACINSNRNFIGIEKEEKYYKIALKRVNDTQMQMKLI